jgi:hypothetical protein
VAVPGSKPTGPGHPGAASPGRPAQPPPGRARTLPAARTLDGLPRPSAGKARGTTGQDSLSPVRGRCTTHRRDQSCLPGHDPAVAPRPHAPPPDRLDRLDIHRRDRLGGILHECAHAA